jgi:glucose/arabinose dehydrogenase
MVRIHSGADGQTPGMRFPRRLVPAILAVLALGLGPAGAQSGPALTVPAGFTIERIATVPQARELAAAPDGDLFVGTSGATVYIVTGATGSAGRPQATPFVTLADAPAAGVTIDGERMYLGSQFGVWELPYRSGDRTPRAQPRKIASVRPAGERGHDTTSVATAGGALYASVGSSCNACDPERDPTRATIQRLELDGGGMQPRAIHVRNAIALAVNPQTGTLWAGVAGQDELAHGHPYEIFDPVTLHAGVADYGWPFCYENQRAVGAHDCAHAVVPRVVFPAYATPIGAAFYPQHPAGAYAFPERYRGGAFVALHGSWHQPPVAPRVAFVPMDGDTPLTPVDWSDPGKQWTEFVGGFQLAGGTRVARPTGVAVGPDGSLFVADDQTGGIYRIRPSEESGAGAYKRPM